MKNPAILIVEGNKILCQDLKGHLSRHGFEVIEAFDKREFAEFGEFGVGPSYVSNISG